MDDIDLNFEEFIAKVNADMVGKIVNLASRTARFAAKTGLAAEYPHYLEPRNYSILRRWTETPLQRRTSEGDYGRAIRLDTGRRRPGQQLHRTHGAVGAWPRDPSKPSKLLQDVCSIGLNLFRQLAVYLAPVLPRLAQQTGELLGKPITSWDQSQKPLLGTPVGKFTHMMQRVDPKRVEAMLAASAEPTEAQPTAGTVPFDTDAPLLAEPVAATIGFDQFAQVDLRVARVITAEDVPGRKN